jgi:hypothetical protein
MIINILCLLTVFITAHKTGTSFFGVLISFILLLAFIFNMIDYINVRKILKKWNTLINTGTIYTNHDDLAKIKKAAKRSYFWW